MITKLKKVIFKIAYPIMRIIWKIFKPNTIGVRVATFNEKDELLLVKHTYRENYFFPGGGIHNHELFVDAALREVFEEVGIKLSAQKLKFQGVYQYFNEGKNDVVVFFVCKVDSKEVALKIDEMEILEARWFSVNNLPSDLAPGVTKRLDDLSTNNDVYYGVW